MFRRSRLRAVFAVVVLSAALVLVGGYASAQLDAGGIRGDGSVEEAFRTGDRSAVVESRDEFTVVATDSAAFVSDEGSGPRQQAELVAFAPDGSIYYHDDDHTRYWDVDPVAGTETTVEYVYADHLDADECHATTICTENGVERVNLTTGESKTVYSRVTPGKHSTRWHDVDRIDDHRLLVADIARDRAYVVDTTTELVEWEWDARSDYSTASGGEYPDDWTHINDVEYVEIDGRDAVMVSLRNQDQVAFVDFERGLLENWTLGADGDHSILYEQHNPDFIPADRGGPAVLVADSENSRIVEYQREDDGERTDGSRASSDSSDGEWNRTWTWTDDRAQWLRDADRLPNGHTLITDSNGDRVLEVDRAGEVVWSADVGFPYEAERLGTGDESSGGESASRLGLESRRSSVARGDAGLRARVAAAVPPKVANAVAYLLPGWMGPTEVAAALALLFAVPLWAVLEWRRSDLAVELQSPLRLYRR